MRVIKVDPLWFPCEAPGMNVGDSIELSDPSVLLAKGTVKPYVEPKPEPIPEPVKEEPKRKAGKK